MTNPLPSIAELLSTQDCSIEDMFFGPIRFFGRQWIWLTDCRNDTSTRVAFKALAFPFLTCGTLLSGGTAFVGALVLPPDEIPSFMENFTQADLYLLRGI